MHNCYCMVQIELWYNDFFKENDMRDDLTFIAVVLDRSRSMSNVRAETIGGFNTFLSDQKEAPGSALFTLVQFDDKYQVDYDGVDIKEVSPLTTITYAPRGNTALLDAIGKTIDTVGAKLASMKESEKPSKVLIMIQTDGQENMSREYKNQQISDLIKHQKDKYNWDFVFVGADEKSITQAKAWGIEQGMTTCYDSHEVGATGGVLRAMSAGAANYRSLGPKKAGGLDFFAVGIK